MSTTTSKADPMEARYGPVLRAMQELTLVAQSAPPPGQGEEAPDGFPADLISAARALTVAAIRAGLSGSIEEEAEKDAEMMAMSAYTRGYVDCYGDGGPGGGRRVQREVVDMLLAPGTYADWGDAE
jgi:hypothetical protein